PHFGEHTPRQTPEPQQASYYFQRGSAPGILLGYLFRDATQAQVLHVLMLLSMIIPRLVLVLYFRQTDAVHTRDHTSCKIVR
ncbi:hypothetical protein EV363DRAFT_1151340, partial [Boletus edulis]